MRQADKRRVHWGNVHSSFIRTRAKRVRREKGLQTGSFPVSSPDGEQKLPQMVGASLPLGERLGGVVFSRRGGYHGMKRRRLKDHRRTVAI